MANIPPIQFKRSHDAGAQPTAPQLAVGELAINMADATLWTKDSDGNIISLGGGAASAGGDSDIVLVLDSDGVQIGAEGGDYEINVITTDRVTSSNSWQDNNTIKKAPAGTRINVYRSLENDKTAYTMERTTNIATNGWGSVISTDGIVSLDYAGVQSYAVGRSWYSTSYRIGNCYRSGSNHATLNLRNDFFIWQFFPTPVSIGDGTDLGSFNNGRPDSTNEYFSHVSFQFYDVDNNLITHQTNIGFGLTNTRTLTAQGEGTINNVSRIMIRCHAGTGTNPGINNIRLKVNGSNNYPTATDVDNRWGCGYRNMVGSTNLADSDEALCLVFVDAPAGGGVGGAWNVFRTTDWRPNGVPADPDQEYYFWFNKPWDVGGGTYGNGRNSYQSSWWNNVEWEYYDRNNTLIVDKNLSTPTYSASNQMIAHRGVHRMVAKPRNLTDGAPVIQQFYPNLGWSSETTIPNTTAVDQPEIWVKNTDLPVASGEYFVDGYRREFPLFTKIIG